MLTTFIRIFIWLVFLTTLTDCIPLAILRPQASYFRHFFIITLYVFKKINIFNFPAQLLKVAMKVRSILALLLHSASNNIHCWLAAHQHTAY